MSKILIFSDVHWSRTTSVIRKLGNKYSMKLEHLINSLNWVNEQAKDYKCDFMICAGDFMDKSTCTDEELTALREIKWNNLPYYFLCGNHESSNTDLKYSSVNALINNSNESKFKLINQPMSLEAGNAQIHFIPYITEHDRLSIANYIEYVDKTKKQIIISHNEIKGINYGGFESQTGFDITDIEQSCDLYLNGHLHNSSWITKKILNVGSLSAHNFTNDSLNYKYGIWILDTEKNTIEFLENPYSFNFYKLEINTEADYKKLDSLKANAIVSIKLAATDNLLSSINEKILAHANILESRIIPVQIVTNENSSRQDISADLGMDHLNEFIKFCQNNLVNSDLLTAELAAICK